MQKQVWKPGNMLYPLPAVLVSCADKNGNDNMMTVAWTGTVCSDPAMVYVSVRPERYSHHMIKETGEYVINLTNKKLLRAVDWCGVRSGREYDKWRETGLTREKADKLSYAPLIAESPVNIECRVTKIMSLGSHDMFLARVEAVHVDEKLLDKRGRLELNSAGLIVYSHGEYLAGGKKLGGFGYTVKKRRG